MGWEEVLTGGARGLTGSALSEGCRASRVKTVHGSESIPAIRIVIWLREWKVNGMGHHGGGEGGAGGLGRVRVGQAMERDDQMTALWQGSGRKTLRIFFGG